MGDVGAEVAANHAVPGGVVLLVELLLDIGRDVLLDVELLQSHVRAVNRVLLHLLVHVGMLDHCLPLRRRHSNLIIGRSFTSAYTIRLYKSHSKQHLRQQQGRYHWMMDGSVKGKSFDHWRQDTFEDEYFLYVTGCHLQCVLFTQSQCSFLCLDGGFVFKQDMHSPLYELIADLIYESFWKKEHFFTDWMETELIVDQFVVLDLAGGEIGGADVAGLGLFPNQVPHIHRQSIHPRDVWINPKAVDLGFREGGDELFKMSLCKVILHTELYLLVLGVLIDGGQILHPHQMLIILNKQHKRGILQDNLPYWHPILDGSILQAVGVNQPLPTQSRVVNQRVAWTFAEDDVAEGIGEVVHVGVAEVVEIVQGWVTQECCLATALRLEGDSRDEVHCCSLVCEDDDSGDVVIHVACDFGHCFGCTLLFSLIFQSSQSSAGENDVIEWFLLF